MVANTIAIIPTFASFEKRFEKLWNKKKSFVQWYVSENLEEGKLDDALNNLREL